MFKKGSLCNFNGCFRQLKQLRELIVNNKSPDHQRHCSTCRSSSSARNTTLSHRTSLLRANSLGSQSYCSATSIAVQQQSHQRQSFRRIENAEVDHNTSFYLSNFAEHEKKTKAYLDVLAKSLAPASEKAIKRMQEQNKMLAEERLSCLVDDRDEFLELSHIAGMDMDYGDVPRAGCIAGIGKVSGQNCVIFCNDSTVKGGTVYPIGLKKQLRLMEIAEQLRLPCIYIVDSGGAFLPLQADIFIHGGKVFYNESVLSSKGIPQFAVVCGNCTAGGAYIPTMANEAFIVHNLGRIFLAGPPLVQAATGEIVSAEELGGALMHSSISGCTDYYASVESEAYEMCRASIATLNVPLFQEPSNFVEPVYDASELPGLIPATDQHTMDIHKVIARIVDGSLFHEFKAKFGPTLVTGFAYIGGHLVGVIGNNGELTGKAADKGAHFVQICSERCIPLIFLQNTDPSESGTVDYEEDGNRLRAHAKMLATVSCSQVPKVTVVVGNSIGPVSYAMAGRAMSPDFLFLWPNARIGLMNAEQLTHHCILDRFQDSRESEDSQAYQTKMSKKFETETAALYSSSNVFDDGIILPIETRKVLIQCLNILPSGIPVERAKLRAPVIRM